MIKAVCAEKAQKLLFSRLEPDRFIIPRLCVSSADSGNVAGLGRCLHVPGLQTQGDHPADGRKVVHLYRQLHQASGAAGNDCPFLPSFHLVPLQALSWTLMLLLTAPNKFLGGKIAHHWNFHNLWKIPLKMRSFVFLLCARVGHC